MKYGYFSMNLGRRIGLIIVMLAVVKETPERRVHENRGMLLQHVPITTKSRKLS